jgi:hypothetical protein
MCRVPTRRLACQNAKGLAGKCVFVCLKGHQEGQCRAGVCILICCSLLANGRLQLHQDAGGTAAPQGPATPGTPLRVQWPLTQPSTTKHNQACMRTVQWKVALMMLFHVHPLYKRTCVCLQLCLHCVQSLQHDPSTAWQVRANSTVSVLSAPFSVLRRRVLHCTTVSIKLCEHAERAIQAFKGGVCPDGSPSRTGCILPGLGSVAA